MPVIEENNFTGSTQSGACNLLVTTYYLAYPQSSNIVVKIPLLVFVFISFSVYANATSQVLYVDGNYPPFSFVEDGKVQGIYPAVLQEVFKKIPEATPELLPISWSEGESRIKKGEALAMMGYYKDVVGRDHIKHYSLPFYTEEVVLICGQQKGDVITGKWPQDFKGKLVANVSGYDGWLRNNVRSDINTQFVNFLEVPNTYIALKMVVKGKLDCALFERHAFEFTFKQLNNGGDYNIALDNKPVVAAFISAETVHVGFAEAPSACQQTEMCELAKRIDEQLTVLKQNGALITIITEQLERYQVNP